MGVFSSIFGSMDQKKLIKLDKMASKIEALESDTAALSDGELRGKTEQFKRRLEAGETLDDLLCEAFAVAREAAWRVLGIKPFHVQLIGGIVLHQGRLAEMKTGEGKTVTATLPAYLNALNGKGVHIVTVNEYLASYQAEEMGKVYNFLGLSVGTIISQMDSAARRALGLGINRETLVSAVLSGHARAAQFPVSPVSPLYPAELESLYSYDDFAAAMEAAGLNTGRTRTVTLLVNQENTFKVSAAEHIAQALSDFDLQIQVEALPWEEYAAALAAGNFDLYYGEVRLPANWDLSALVGTGGSLNYGGWADPQTEQLLAACAAAEDRAAALSDLCAYLQQQAPILPLCFKSSSVLYQTGAVSGLTPTAAEPFYDLPSCQIHLRQP